MNMKNPYLWSFRIKLLLFVIKRFINCLWGHSS